MLILSHRKIYSILFTRYIYYHKSFIVDINTITNSITITNTKVNNDLFCYFDAVTKISNCKGLKFL